MINVIKDPIQKAKENPSSLRLAINGKCWECIGAGADPHPRAAIKDCICYDCTLYPVRPYQSKEIEEEMEELENDTNHPI